MKRELTSHRERAERVSLMWTFACLLTFSVGVLTGMAIITILI